MIEIWKKVEDFNCIWVSSQGNVEERLPCGKRDRVRHLKNSYRSQVYINDNGKRIKVMLNRMVFKAFFPEKYEESKTMIHEDGNPFNLSLIHI